MLRSTLHEVLWLYMDMVLNSDELLKSTLVAQSAGM